MAQTSPGRASLCKVWTPWSDNAKNLKELHVLLTDKAQLDDIFNRLFDEETSPAE